jgi:hypothetical protein
MGGEKCVRRKAEVVVAAVKVGARIGLLDGSGQVVVGMVTRAGSLARGRVGGREGKLGIGSVGVATAKDEADNNNGRRWATERMKVYKKS